ncbi:class I SAM-dependent methyltransferase [Prosthecobacter sp.]|uniref:class I SAM-dependent methyltransferase n=1 Tax=Prosthecobacter sp. TaxID=1965333 RepID=UPI0037C62BFB
MQSLGRVFLPQYLHERMQVDRYPILRFIRDEAIPLMKPGVKVLDAGSGRLPEQTLRAEILATGAELHTLDFCAGEGVDFVGDVSAMPFGDECYDIVLSTQVLEHVKDPAGVCAEMARVLKPGGHLFLTTPQSSPIHNEPWNFFNFTHYGLELLFQNAGLSVVKKDPQGGHFALLAFMLHWTVRVFERKKMSPLLKVPLMLASKFLFGFVTKIILLWLDSWDKEPTNTLGWNFHGQKPKVE